VKKVFDLGHIGGEKATVGPDGVATKGDGSGLGDAVGAAAGLDELVVIAPAGDSDEAEAFARSTGARLTTVAGPSDVADALAEVLSS
jgi:hypothetical protein